VIAKPIEAMTSLDRNYPPGLADGQSLIKTEFQDGLAHFAF
jgi:hypothetical protein